jgi:hypothetical protein
MAFESAVLGTLAVYYDTVGLCYTDQKEKEYNLGSLSDYFSVDREKNFKENKFLCGIIGHKGKCREIEVTLPG